jgi:AraC-like DNA-binding protein/quercetin dioxygenase-like cupin family protein
MRLAGGVFLDGEMRGAWSILSQVTHEECAMYMPTLPPTSHVIAYHYVRSGRLECHIEGDEETVQVSAGEIVLLPSNRPHLLHGRERSKPISGADMVLPIGDDGRYCVRLGESGELTSVYCGFLAGTTPDNMLLQSLPPIMVIAIEDVPASDWIRRSIDFAAESLSRQSPEMVGKLAEGLFAEAVRRYIDALPDNAAGWLAGLKDPAVGRTIALIHRDYAEALTLEDLAREARVSKTVLGERFRELLGESPMQYCARWRMRVAADMLRQERHNACSVAYSVGFNSEAAFNRAFKREFGLPPAAWQRMRAAG